MFKDELTLIALKNKAKPSISTNKAVEVFKDAVRGALGRNLADAPAPKNL